MLRGIYTGASGMTAMQVKMDTVANNLANVDKTAFKEDVTIFRANPEVLIHRTRDDGVGWVPMGGFDISPLVGKLGTGSEVNEIFTRFDQGALKRTERDQDVAINGDGFFVVQSQAGPRLTRSGAFILDRNGMLVTPDGFPLMGEKGPIQVNHNNYIIKTNGEVWINQAVGNDPKNFTSKDVNQWENPVLLDTLQIRTVDHPRHLDKVGQSFYNTTPESGDMRPVDQVKAPEILQGFLEASNVNIVTEMVNMIEVQRMYEANQRAITTHDGMLGTLINQVLRV
ncbi:flagellar hook-basal body protein [Turneriella parva]|uniref:Flagellar hook-basal body protein n=1 Tax=Turneriella parva (strain ATCC BAA-1111 / DSM 21527 / NCTC 11395 / H) TaxID=869212 RepID=I4B5H0_TURPD|nr:flagellar hook-basal body protein [Turneriella parva]AFM12527.1 flagellar hook-basal body protein [Turneriella parva DSM 21527]